MQNECAKWIELFEPYDFFEDYQDFVEINIVAKESNDFHAWKGFITS